MVDTMDAQSRSRRMARVKDRDTKPELIVRRCLHRLGYRFRLHRRDLPGTPDIVLPRYRAAILVHGCFWHRHPDPACKLARMPKSRLDFWGPKLEANRVRDERQLVELESRGWHVLTLWECELRKLDGLAERFQAFLEPLGRNECTRSSCSPALAGSA
jgi:DNA mismatch endonuclease (patch repair protein)